MQSNATTNIGAVGVNAVVRDDLAVSVAIANSLTVRGASAIAMGNGASADGAGAMAFGDGAVANRDGQVSLSLATTRDTTAG